VVGLKVNAVVEMLIYNRWGQQVFQSSDVKVGWNGYYKGVKADNGVYFYSIKITFPTGETKIEQGDLTLIR
jgi:gliding motility-associated-like protein